MGTARLTERERVTLEHLKQAKELGSSLGDYATAFNLSVKDLYNGRTQLQRKGPFACGWLRWRRRLRKKACC